MPGALPEGHVLHERAIAPHQRMRGKARGGELAEKGCASGGNVPVKSRSIHGPPIPRAAG